MMERIKKLGREGLTVVTILVVVAGGCSKLGDEVSRYEWDNFCTNCHGGLDNPYGSPPTDTRGNTATDTMTVGAHTVYLANTDFLCDQCHPAVYTPESALGDPRHIDGPPAEVVFGPNSLAVLGGASPVYERETGTCRNTYCHGATLEGGTLKDPVWNRVGVGETACGTCHRPQWSEPPPIEESGDILGKSVHDLHSYDPRGPRLDCWTCHPEKPARHHIDGLIRLKDGAETLTDTEVCADCHGDAAAESKQYWEQPRDEWRQADDTVYCLNCHSSGSPAINGQQAPAIGANYSTTGHGNSGTFAATQHGSQGPGFSCDMCHDPDAPHLISAPGPEYRLRIDNSENGLCLDCHATDAVGSLGYVATARVVTHSSATTGRHTGVSQYDYQCVTCHDPHGTSNLAMIRLSIDGEFGEEAEVEFEGDDLTGLDPTTDPNNGVCDACHEQDSEAHEETNHPNNHNHGMSCMICHRHDRSFWF